MTAPQIIGLMGYAGAGKSAVARILCDEHGFVSPHIGRPLKRMLAALLEEIGYDAATIARYIDGDLKRSVIPELGVTSTEAQQTLGLEWGRDCIRPDLWLSLWLAKADRIATAGGRVVQESVRFANEAEALRARGAIIVEVQRPGVGPHSDHASERLPAEPEVIISNDGDLLDLSGRVRDALKIHEVA
jgi:hypothetical protein